VAGVTRRLRVLTWHVHGSYLWYLSHIRHELYLPVGAGRPHGYGGRAGGWAWPPTVHEVPVERLGDLEVDVVLHQSHATWTDRHRLLSPAQLAVPQVVLEHDPPREVPTDTRHPVDDPGALVVHVTHFNRLMWDNGSTPTAVIEHGVTVPPRATYEGPASKERGVVVVNGLRSRGRRLGADVFAAVRDRARVPLDLVGIDSASLGGLGEVPPPELPAFLGHYRFYFHPVRYTSLGLALCEAMTVGLPVVGLATTELPAIVTDGVDGFVSNDVDRLVDVMRTLLDDADLAARVGAAGRDTALRRFSLSRFTHEWEALLESLVPRPGPG
jgi:hypothetical protein